jgi:hypothetical protein
MASVSVPYDTLSKCAAGKAYIVFRYISGSSVSEYEFTFYSKSESSYTMSNTTNYTEYYTFRNATGYSAYAYVSYTDATAKPSTSTITISYGSYYTGTPKTPTYSSAQYNLGYYYSTSSSSSINTTTYLYTGEYGLYLAATCTGQPYSWGSAQYCHLKTESSYYTNSTSYSKAIKQTLTVLGAQRVFERYVTYSSSWTYGAWKEVTHNFAKTVIQPLSSTYTYLLSNLVPTNQTGYYRLTISSYNGADTFTINNSGTAVMSNIVQLDGIYQYSGGTWMPTGRVTVVSSTGGVSCTLGSSLNSTAAVAGGSTTSQTFYITAQQVG